MFLLVGCNKTMEQGSWVSGQDCLLLFFLSSLDGIGSKPVWEYSSTLPSVSSVLQIPKLFQSRHLPFPFIYSAEHCWWKSSVVQAEIETSCKWIISTSDRSLTSVSLLLFLTLPKSSLQTSCPSPTHFRPFPYFQFPEQFWFRYIFSKKYLWSIYRVFFFLSLNPSVTLSILKTELNLLMLLIGLD